MVTPACTVWRYRLTAYRRRRIALPLTAAASLSLIQYAAASGTYHPQKNTGTHTRDITPGGLLSTCYILSIPQARGGERRRLQIKDSNTRHHSYAGNDLIRAWHACYAPPRFSHNTMP